MGGAANHQLISQPTADKWIIASGLTCFASSGFIVALILLTFYWVWDWWEVKLRQKLFSHSLVLTASSFQWVLPAFAVKRRALSLGEGPVTASSPNQSDYMRGGLQIAEMTARSDTITSSVWAGESQKSVKEHSSSHDWRWVLLWLHDFKPLISLETRINPSGQQLKCSVKLFDLRSMIKNHRFYKKLH